MKPTVWYLLGMDGLFAIVSIAAPSSGVIPGQLYLYAVEPIFAAIIAGVTYIIVRGQRDRVRHASDKAIIVGSVVAGWFVAYFATGIVLTYQHNAVAASWRAIGMNVVAFGVIAASLEYVRHAIMMLGGRRNVVWLGAIVSVVFAIAQIGAMPVSQLNTVVNVIKLIVANIMPTVAASFLLTYLAFTAGLPAQMTYRLGVLAATLLPPIIPKHDWYLTGIISLLLAIIVYITIDQTRDGVQERS